MRTQVMYSSEMPKAVAEFRKMIGVNMVSIIKEMQTKIAAGRTDVKFARIPWMISINSAKPDHQLHDFETMYAFAYNFETGMLSDAHYCGSGISTINHMGEQGSKGYVPPQHTCLMFLRRSHGNSWALDLVTSQQAALPGMNILQLKGK